MATADGWVDSLGRPFLRVLLPGLEDLLEMKVDTGFNGALWTGSGEAGRIALQLLPNAVAYTLAGGRRADVRLGVVRLSWLDQEREVDVAIVPEERRRRETPLLGTQVLTEWGCTLMIDFPRRLVRVST